MDKEQRQTSTGRATYHGEQVKPEQQDAVADLSIARKEAESPMFGKELMEEVCGRSNLIKALGKVEGNRGAPGVDGMKTSDLRKHLKESWPSIKQQLLEGEYVPQPVRRVEIPKQKGKDKRKLGIPTVLDRFIQQAILQVLQGEWDHTFSATSYGFRPKRSCHQAIAKAQAYLEAGYEWVVDIDLEKFFDRVNHDRLMSRLAKGITDKRVLKLIRGYLNAGIMEDGLVIHQREGTPQGGPLSPFLSNVVLDELDKELETRGHQFVRYADDCNIYVRSQRAGERVMRSVSDYITRRLKLKVNKGKSAVGRPSERKFLGFSFTKGKYLNRRKIAPESIQRFRERVCKLTRRNRRIGMRRRIEDLSNYLEGWKGYYGYCQTRRVLEDLDGWIRRRLRCVLWKQWPTYRKRRNEMIKRGTPRLLAMRNAWSDSGPWRMSRSKGMNIAYPKTYFDALGLTTLAPG